MRLFLVLIGLVFVINGAPVFAQEEGILPSIEQSSVADQNFENRLELARAMHELRPSADQVDAAIDNVALRLPANQQETFKSSMRNLLNYRTIEKISIHAMAETYTEEELKAMVEYYSKPEAQSASKKFAEYQAKVAPEIVQMIDKAIMKLKTGGDGQ